VEVLATFQKLWNGIRGYGSLSYIFSARAPTWAEAANPARGGAGAAAASPLRVATTAVVMIIEKRILKLEKISLLGKFQF
jgi:hypothetical protein